MAFFLLIDANNVNSNIYCLYVSSITNKSRGIEAIYCHSIYSQGYSFDALCKDTGDQLIKIYFFLRKISMDTLGQDRHKIHASSSTKRRYLF